MKYAQMVIGPAGSGKSTYCATLQSHCKIVGRTMFVINLDPAAESFTYECSLDVRELISVDDVLEDKEMAMGPNGALIFCMEYLANNLEWLKEHLGEAEDDYFLFDCPGQIELYSHLSAMGQIVNALKQWDFNVCSTFVMDTSFCLDANKFFSASLIALSTLISLAIPAVNVLSKMDLLSKKDHENLHNLLDGNFDQITDTQDNTKWNQMHRKLTEAISSVLNDYNLMRFLTLDVEDEDSIEDLLLSIDNIIQYGEAADVKDRYPSEN